MITIPVYFTFERKLKKSTTSLISLNWYRNAYHFDQNKVKQFMHKEILPQLSGSTYKQYEVLYVYYYKSKTSDLGNVTAMASKWLNDTLKESSAIEDDNVQYLLAEYHLVGTMDKDNPRVEVYIKEMTESPLTEFIEYFTKDTNE